MWTGHVDSSPAPPLGKCIWETTEQMKWNLNRRHGQIAGDIRLRGQPLAPALITPACGPINAGGCKRIIHTRTAQPALAPKEVGNYKAVASYFGPQYSYLKVLAPLLR